MEKYEFQRRGLTKKNNIWGWGAQKGGAWTVCRFKGWIGRKEGVVFLGGEGGRYPNAHYGHRYSSAYCTQFLPLKFSSLKTDS